MEANIMAKKKEKKSKKSKKIDSIFSLSSLSMHIYGCIRPFSVANMVLFPSTCRYCKAVKSCPVRRS